MLQIVLYILRNRRKWFNNITSVHTIVVLLQKSQYFENLFNGI
jgi:hypothetical protein